jgi:hypothetical protein
MKSLRLLFLATAAATSIGCITFLTQIRVRPDGGGTMVQTITMNPRQMKETMETVAKGMGAKATESKDGDGKVESKPEARTDEAGPFKENDLKEKARDLGDGVTFVSAEKIDTETAAGVRVTYAFKDINRLSINPKPGAALGTEAAGSSAKGAVKFRFEKKKEKSILTVVIPKGKAPAAEKEKPPAAQSAETDAQQLQMMRQMFRGMHIGLSVEVGGKLLKTDAPYVSGNTVTLFDIDFDPLLSDAKSLATLNEKLSGAMGDDAKTVAALQGIPGLKISAGPEIRIELSADR